MLLLLLLLFRKYRESVTSVPTKQNRLTFLKNNSMIQKFQVRVLRKAQGYGSNTLQPLYEVGRSFTF